MPAFPAVGDPGTDTVAPPNDWGTKILAAIAVSENLANGQMVDGVMFGTNPASAGTIRLPNAGWVAGRNAANSADLNMWRVNSANVLQPGTGIYRDDDSSYTDGDPTTWLGLRRRTTITTTNKSVIQAIAFVSGTNTGGERMTGIASTVKDSSAVVNKTITNMTRVGTTVTVTANAHGFANGDHIAIYGTLHTFNAEVNGNWTVANVAANTFDITVPGLSSGSYTSGGTATNRSMYYAFGGFVYPSIARGGLTGTAAFADDVACYVAGNYGTAKGTDMFYGARNAAIAGSEFTTLLTFDTFADYGIRLNGTIVNYGLDFSAGTFGNQIRLKNNNWVVGRNAAGSGDVNMIRLNATDQVELSSPVLIGTTPASAGVIRIPNNNVIVARNAANSGDVSLILANASDEIQIGQAAVIRFPATIGRMTDFNFEVSGGTGLKIGTATTQKIGFWNATPVVRPSAYTKTNVTTDRSFDANATTLDELADVVGTLIGDLQSVGLIG